MNNSLLAPVSGPSFSPPQASQGGMFKCINGMEGREGSGGTQGTRCRVNIFLSTLGVRAGH